MAVEEQRRPGSGGDPASVDRPALGARSEGHRVEDDLAPGPVRRGQVAALASEGDREPERAGAVEGRLDHLALGQRLELPVEGALVDIAVRVHRDEGLGARPLRRDHERGGRERADQDGGGASPPHARARGVHEAMLSSVSASTPGRRGVSEAGRGSCSVMGSPWLSIEPSRRGRLSHRLAKTGLTVGPVATGKGLGGRALRRFRRFAVFTHRAWIQGGHPRGAHGNSGPAAHAQFPLPAKNV